ncbi:VIT1/CCC1 transporter family protein [Paracoccus aminophilus]|uniref:Manganese/iron transporter n=1 Tax=Paracoccus aminophilus JCM 7686 TaxID=1367847 RepID=S5YTY8_PARAH|nr:VIT family protein [Paracoccus aminophilus]AGT08691.1 manganese/iron transporter [Paracoccus aminophilus JCM 7686]
MNRPHHLPDPSAHPDDPHYVGRLGWLRAAVLGANDGIVSTGAIIMGVAAAEPSPRAILIAGVAGLTAGAMSMAAGEYVSVHSQSDTERADIERERQALRDMPEDELHELAAIYEERGMTPATALQAAREVSEHDALGAHIRDELGLTEASAANPLQAALTSAVTFSTAGAVPLLAAIIAPIEHVLIAVLLATVVALGILGAIGAKAGGAPMGRAALRVMVWGTIALGITAAVGKIFGVAA